MDLPRFRLEDTVVPSPYSKQHMGFGPSTIPPLVHAQPLSFARTEVIDRVPIAHTVTARAFFPK